MTATSAFTDDPFITAARAADAPAVAWDGHHLTYARLDAAVADLARRLAPLGAARACVLVMGPLTPAYVVGLLAAWRAGAVPVPVDAGLTPEQYAWLARRTRPAVVISSDVTPVGQYRGSGTGPAEVLLDAATGAVVVESYPQVPDGSVVFGDPDAGYVIPTSGSTGEPKAVVGSRRGLAGFLGWFRDEFALGPADRCAAVTRVNFDPSLRELLGVLGVGGTLALPPVDAQLDLSALAGHLVEGRPTVAFLVPSTALLLAGEPALAEAGLPDLRLLFFAGEVLGRRVVERWSALAPHAEIVNLYGQTEATLAQLYRRDVQRLTHDGARSTPVGGPRPGVSVTLAEPDADGTGEVVLTVDAPALGLLRAPSGDGGDGVHRTDPFPAPLPTGDLGFLGSDGDLVVIGRRDHDIKVGGRRVSFHGFIDAVEALDGVRQCVVVERDGPQVFIAAEAADAAHTAGAALRDAVHGAGRSLGLPRFALHVRPDLPTLRSGKADRRALLASLGDCSGDGPADVTPDDQAPGTGPAGIERTLRAALGARADEDVLTEAGVSSLDLVAAVARIRRTYGIRLTVHECFGLGDVPSLAREIDRRRHAPAAPDTAAPAVAAPAAAPRDRYPLSTRQVGYLRICMPQGNGNWCNLSREITLPRRTEAADVEAALGTLLARHDALGLALAPDGRHQTFTAAAGLACPVEAVDTGLAVDSAEHRDRVQRARAALVSRLIDPAKPPPLRALLVRGSDGASVVLVVHHLFVDGLSMDTLTGELTALLTGRGLDAGAPQNSYRDYCLATERSDEPNASAAYWRALLAGATQTRLPEYAEHGGPQGELLSLPLGALGTREVHRLARDLGVSAFTVVLAAFERAVAETFGLDRLPVIVVSQDRGETGAGTVGMFTSTLTVRGPGDPSLSHNITALAGQLTDGTAHGDWEFDQRVDDLGLGGGDCFPLSTVLFNQRPLPRGLRARDLGSWRPRALGRALPYQLQGELQMSGAELVMAYYYRKGIARTDEIDRVHRALLRTVRAGREATRG
ncbi:AMP-binding protein [Streptomyces sp. NPDC052114]|uniref:AMP-binding protein n=1 Tax=unclassified Streptomyces TaxID=2593676 RepID=UPI003447E88D